MSRPKLLYVGTYSEPISFASGTVFQGRGRGIHILRVDEAAGTLTEISAVAGVRNPSYLAFHPTQRFLYAVSELKEFDGRFGGAVTAFAIDEAGGLTLLNSVPTHGTDPCHLCVDRSGRHVLIANYSSGHITVVPIRPDGSLGVASQVVAHAGSSVDPVRQTGPHLHHVTFDASGRLFATDLGLDRVFVYRLDAERGILSADDPPYFATAPGAGPRQTVLHPDGRRAYVLNELGSSVMACTIAAGRVAPGQTVSTLPEEFAGANTCAEAQISPSGRFLYASNRGHNSIAVFSISPGGELVSRGHVGTGGSTPRNFDLDASGTLLAAANQDSGTVVLFRIDPETGMPAPTGSVAHVGTPVCVRFF